MAIMTAVTTTTASTSRPFLGVDWRPMARPALAIAIIVITYRVSLQTLLDSMRLDTPLAHLSLVPLIALGLAYAYRNTEVGPSIHDRQLDWILGLFMMSVALGANVLLPARLSTEFWIWRIDLLTLPVFVAGVITLLFGSRALWKYRFAVLFLFLAWPYPYNIALDKWLGKGKWDVIHFNHGIHDLKYMPDGKRQVEPADYEANLRTITSKLKATGAKVIWATTTPIPDGDLTPQRKFGKVPEYNEIAAKVMKENGVSINELNAHITPRIAELQNPKDVHFKTAGSEFLAEKVAAEILKALGQ